MKIQTNVPLVGQYFHSIGPDGMLLWQGIVIGNPQPGWYLLQLFEWLMGEPNVRRLVRIEEMTTWLFYPDDVTMAHSYERGVARAGGKYRAPEPAPEPLSDADIQRVLDARRSRSYPPDSNS